MGTERVVERDSGTLFENHVVPLSLPVTSTSKQAINRASKH